MESLVGHHLFLLGFLLIFLLHGSHANGGAQKLLPSYYGIDVLNRSSFPNGFVFGAASAAYQFEGAWNIDGKGSSNWDYFTHKYPGKIADRSSGDVAADSYHRYKEDVKLLKEMNADSYRFSISWSRIVPYGKISKGINEKGIEYYNNLINELLDNGLTPTVTIFHWDIPQALEEEYGGFLSPQVVKDFHDYANLCFQRFGDRVKFWITLNEPYSYTTTGYNTGIFAPGRCSAWMQNNCTGGNSGTEPYLVGHHQLLAHADVVKLYKKKYQAQQKGKIGITNFAPWLLPLTNSRLDKRATIRGLDFSLGWFLNPLVYGDYPATMRNLVGGRLPRFTTEQSRQLLGSYDFMGINYYTTLYAFHSTTPPTNEYLSYTTDSRVNTTAVRSNKLIGQQAASPWLFVYPRGIWNLLIYVKNKYKNPIIYITENGIDEFNNANLTLEESLQDNFRIQFYYSHLQFLRKAIQNGVRVKGFFGWALLDNFEWASGYTVRFGINFVDYKTLQRYRKLSSYWFERFLQK